MINISSSDVVLKVISVDIYSNSRNFKRINSNTEIYKINEEFKNLYDEVEEDYNLPIINENTLIEELDVSFDLYFDDRIKNKQDKMNKAYNNIVKKANSYKSIESDLLSHISNNSSSCNKLLI
jgi:hypothetical protein